MTSLTQQITVWFGKSGGRVAKPRGGGTFVASRAAARPVLSENRSYKVSVPVRKSTAQAWIFGAGLAALNGALLITYFFSINHFAAKGYEMKQLSLSVQQLAEQNKKLQVQTSEAQAVTSFGDHLAAEGYIPVTKVEYIQEKHYSER